MLYAAIVAFVIVAGLPFIGWAVSGPHRDSSSRLYALGSMFYALAVAVYLFIPELPSSLRLLLVRFFACLAILFLNEFVRRIADPACKPQYLLWTSVLIAVPIILGIEGYIGPRGATLHHLLLIFIQVGWTFNIRAARQAVDSRGISSMGAAVVVLVLANVFQAVFIQSTGAILMPNLQSLEGFVIFLANILWVMLFSVGFWAYSLDVSRRSQVAAATTHAAEVERRRAAEQVSAQLTELVRQRDQLIMRHSRFEALNNVGVFNAAVIHELSQPLQRIMINSDLLARANSLSDWSSRQAVTDIAQDSRLTGEIISSIRSLLTNVSVPDSKVAPIEALDAVRPMLESQAKADRVELVFNLSSFGSDEVLSVTGVLFHRVILNLFANSIAALKKVATRQANFHPRMRVTTERESVGEKNWFTLAVWDNGGGFPAEFDSSFQSLGALSTSGGMGLGLVISRQILLMWGGSLSVASADGGTEVCLKIPLTRSH